MPDVEQKLYSVHEAGKILGRREAAMRALIQRRELPVTRMGHRVFISTETIQHALKGQLIVDSARPWDESAKHNTRR